PLACSDRSRSGTRSTSTNTSFQNSLETGEYGLGLKDWSRNEARTGSVPTAAPPSWSIQSDSSARSVKSPHPQLRADRAAYRGRTAPQVRSWAVGQVMVATMKRAEDAIGGWRKLIGG